MNLRVLQTIGQSTTGGNTFVLGLPPSVVPVPKKAAGQKPEPATPAADEQS